VCVDVLVLISFYVSLFSDSQAKAMRVRRRKRRCSGSKTCLRTSSLSPRARARIMLVAAGESITHFTYLVVYPSRYSSL
jgi:hypothetical protein